MRKADDVAKQVCEAFAYEHPHEFAMMAREALPPGAFAEAEKEGFDPRILCGMKEIVQPFLDDLLSMQKRRAAELRRN